TGSRSGVNGSEDGSASRCSTQPDTERIIIASRSPCAMRCMDLREGERVAARFMSVSSIIHGSFLIPPNHHVSPEQDAGMSSGHQVAISLPGAGGRHFNFTYLLTYRPWFNSQSRPWVGR